MRLTVVSRVSDTMEGYLEKATRTGKLIVPSKLGMVPEEAYHIPLQQLSLAGNMLKTLDPRLGNVRYWCQCSTPRRLALKSCLRDA